MSFLTNLSSKMIYPLLPIFLATVPGAGAVMLGLIEGFAECTAAQVKFASGKANKANYPVTRFMCCHRQPHHD